jgi:hypothetical protein
MSTCQGCDRQLNDAYLCAECEAEVRDTYTDLALGCRLHIGDTPIDKRSASFLKYLMGARVGHTRMGDSERRSNENSRPALARLTGNEADSFKGSPLELCNEIHDKISYWAVAASGKYETLTQEDK